MAKRRIILKGIIITWFVMRKQTTQGKQVHFTLISCSRSGKSWDLGVSLGRLWKMTLIVQNNLRSFFGEIRLNQIDIQVISESVQENGQILVMEDFEKKNLS